MTYLRHSSRHIHQTLYKHVGHHLSVLGWLNTATSPLSTVAVTMRTEMPEEYEQVRQLDPGTVAVTLGDFDDTFGLELGSELVGQRVTSFYDVIMDTEAGASAVADDIRDILKGRLPNTGLVLAVYDFTATTPVAVSGWSLELDDITREHGPLKNWQMVKATHQLVFDDTIGTRVSTGYPNASYFGQVP